MSQATPLQETLMPRVSKEQAGHNRRAIQTASARLFRERGLNGVSVADLMAAAGLTHGGFYGHFDSKDALAAVACSTAFEQSAQRWSKRIEGQPDSAAALTALIDGYLSGQSRDEAGSGCSMTALATDVAREPAEKPIHGAYVAGVKKLLNVIVLLQESGDKNADYRQAVTQLATLVGALTLARATREDTISDDFLVLVRQHLVQAVGPARKKSRKHPKIGGMHRKLVEK
jgi:TetR/AcrR family transcriptional repressor of nem operon